MHGERCSGSQKHSYLAICWKQHAIIVLFNAELISFGCLAAFNKWLACLFVLGSHGEHRGHKRGPCGSIVLQRNYQLDLFKCKPNEDQLEMNIKSLNLQCKQFTLFFFYWGNPKFGEFGGIVFKYWKLKTKCLLGTFYS